jgi:hypothetical protein
MFLDGIQDKISPPPPADAVSGQYELDPAIVDHLEVYLLNYFKPGLGKQDAGTALRRAVFNRIGCNSCHTSDLQINHDRRVAGAIIIFCDLETRYGQGIGLAERQRHDDRSQIHRPMRHDHRR